MKKSPIRVNERFSTAGSLLPGSVVAAGGAGGDLPCPTPPGDARHGPLPKGGRQVSCVQPLA